MSPKFFIFVPEEEEVVMLEVGVAAMGLAL
jgi:hypothetical protein